MSKWIISLIYLITIFLISQNSQALRKHRFQKKPSSIRDDEKRENDENSNDVEPFAVLPDPDVFLDLINNLSTAEYHRNALVQWNFESNITEVTRNQALKSSLGLAKFQKTIWKTVMKYDWHNFNDNPSVKRQFEMLSILGSAALPDDKYAKLDQVVNNMESIYSTATIAPFVKKNSTELENNEKKQLRLEPDLIKIMAESNDVEELAYVWKAWRDATGRKMKKEYINYVELMKEVAKLNNFSSVQKYWTHEYEDPDFENTILKMWQEIKPFYLELHAYVRNRLRVKYGSEVISESGYIPAHLFGDLWTQSWIHLNKDTMPYPHNAIPDMTNGLRKNNFTILEFFKLAENFFHSLGFPMLPKKFWKKSIIQRPIDNKTELVCHGSAWDMYNGNDFRIKMCTEINYDDLLIVHHEMGHIQYYIQYKDQPIIFRDGANPGFHEAIGDTIALSVSSLPHACGLGLIENSDYQEKLEINYLYMMALQKVVFIPFAYCVDKWRWTIFTGKVSADTYNSLWWKFRADIQGIEPPNDRDEIDFDPGAKYHIAANVPYIRYFVSFIIQFQFHEALCLNAGQYDPNDIHRPLHRCDIYGSMEAGIALRQMLKLGSSLPWQDAMEQLTGHREMQTGGLMTYFRPLYDWLKNENKRTKEPVGF